MHCHTHTAHIDMDKEPDKIGTDIIGTHNHSGLFTTFMYHGPLLVAYASSPCP